MTDETIQCLVEGIYYAVGEYQADVRRAQAFGDADDMAKAIAARNAAEDIMEIVYSTINAE